jgi:hypothetical protein
VRAASAIGDFLSFWTLHIWILKSALQLYCSTVFVEYGLRRSLGRLFAFEYPFGAHRLFIQPWKRNGDGVTKFKLTCRIDVSFFFIAQDITLFAEQKVQI